MNKPGFLRLSAAMFYDLLLLVAILFFATLLALPFNQGKAFEGQFIYPIYLVAVSFLFYGWFWTHGGQTLGLKSWKIKLISEKEQAITWQQALIRFVTAILSWSCLGLGFLWALFDKQNRTWHDILSKSGLFTDSVNK
jgi:uncharacterized RDD family membrane protein YckC